MSNFALKAIRSVIRAKESMFGSMPMESRSLFAQEMARRQSGRVIDQIGNPFQDVRSMGGAQNISNYQIGQNREVLVQWNSVCLPTLADCNVGCTLDMAENIPDPDVYRLRVEKCASTGTFMMRDCDFIGKEWTEDWAVLFSKHLTKHYQAIEEAISRSGIESAKDYAGRPHYIPKGSGMALSETDNCVLVHPDAINADIVYSIKEISKAQGESADAILFDSNVLNTVFERSIDESGATTVEGTSVIKFRRVNYVNIFEEAINNDNVGDSPLYNEFLTVDPESMFLSNYVDYPNEFFVDLGTNGLSVIQFTLPNLPLRGNLYVQKDCIDYNGVPYNVFKFKPLVHYDWHRRPTDCHAEATGITYYKVDCIDYPGPCDPVVDNCAGYTFDVAGVVVGVGTATIDTMPVTSNETITNIDATLHFQDYHTAPIDTFDWSEIQAGPLVLNLEPGTYQIAYTVTATDGEGECTKLIVEEFCVEHCDDGLPKEGEINP